MNYKNFQPSIYIDLIFPSSQIVIEIEIQSSYSKLI